MDDYADIYYVDSRNATSRDHRTQAGQRPVSWFPGRPMPMPPAQTMYVQPQRPVTQPIIYAGPPVPQNAASMLLGRLTTGQIIEMIVQIFAALQSLPNAPAPTEETSTDVANLVLYQNALASHAKRDEQVRTLGSLVAKLIG
jgi:hypothetical protein